MGIFIKSRKSRVQLKLERKLSDVAREIKEIADLIKLADRCFNEVSDEDLTEALIYDRSALDARYNYLIKEAKRLEGELSASKDFPNSKKNT